MTKRCAKFKRSKGDYYVTPPKAVDPLLPFLPPRCSFVEPCAGNGALVDALEAAGHKPLLLLDVEPKPSAHEIQTRDAMSLTDADVETADYIITNPPWTRAILHPMIEHLSNLRPTWLLFDADWMHTKQAQQSLRRCSMIVSVGRVSWMGNGVSGLDNSAWYLFDRYNVAPTKFVGRAA
jgi:hypothetical protein